MKLILASLFALSVTAAAAERPNILFLFADDWGRYASAYAATESQPSPNQVVKTPNIDAVAKRGVLFKNAYVNAPSCTPCRSSLLSGRYFFNTGRAAILNGAVWDGSVPAWPLLLKDAGYHIGKFHKVWSPGTPADAPYGGQQFAFEKAGGAFNNFSENVAKMVRNGIALDTAKQKLYDEVRGNFDAFLKARTEGGKPWCFWFGPTNVHRAWEKGSGKAQWGIEPEALKGKLAKHLPDVPEVREDFADYLGEIQAWDTAIGVILKRLEESGELDRTLIVISGDHGAPGFPAGKCNLYDFGVGVSLIAAGPGIKAGRVVDDFVSLPDLAPTFLDLGGAKLPEGMNARSLVNVLHSEKSGQVDESRTWVISGRERHVAGAREGNLPYPHRALRTKEFLYIRNFMPDRWPMGDPKTVTETTAPATEELEDSTYAAYADMDASPTKAWLIANRNESQWKWNYDYAFAKRPAEEFYDLSQDPAQVDNRADDPAYADKLRSAREQLMKILTDAGDPRVTGSGDTFDKAPFTDAKSEDPKAKRGKGKAK